MAALFWMDSPQPPDPAWSMARVEHCLTQIWAVVLRIAAGNVPCVLDTTNDWHVIRGSPRELHQELTFIRIAPYRFAVAELPTNCRATDKFC